MTFQQFSKFVFSMFSIRAYNKKLIPFLYISPYFGIFILFYEEIYSFIIICNCMGFSILKTNVSSMKAIHIDVDVKIWKNRNKENSYFVIYLYFKIYFKIYFQVELAISMYNSVWKPNILYIAKNWRISAFMKCYIWAVFIVVIRLE